MRALTVAARHPRITLIVWGLPVLMLIGLGIGAQGRLGAPDLVAPGSSSAHARAIGEQRFGRSTVVPVLLTGAPAAVRASGGALAAGARAQRIAARPPAPAAGGAELVVLAVPDDGSARRPEAGTHAVETVRRLVAARVPSHVAARISGEAVVNEQLKSSSEDAAKRGELVAAPILIVVLLVVLGAPLPALLCGLLGGLSVLAGMGVLRVLSGFTDLTVFAATLTSMMGLALGVDYALLVITRYREERARGMSPQDAGAAAAATAGRTLLFAAAALTAAMLTAIAISTGNLLVSPAVGVLAAAAVALASAIVALPAVLVLADPWLERGRVRQRAAGAGVGGGGVARAARAALRRPLLAALIVVVPLVALAIPGTTVKTGPGDVRQLPASTTARHDVEAVARAVGPGWTAPFQLILHADRPLSARSLTAFAAWQAVVRHDPDVVAVLAPVERAPDGRALRVTVIPRTAPNTPATEALDARLARHARAFPPDGGTRIAVGGVAAELAGWDRATADQLPVVVLGLALVTFLVLLVVLRAPLLALVSVALNLLTVAVAFGAIVLLYQGDSPPLGGAGYLEVIAMVSMFTVMFGLSIDYQVFLLDRMREGLAETGRPADAITWGLDRTARVITGAAAIMVGVFLAFGTTAVATVQQFGIGLAVAIAVDATVIRLVLLPIAMRLGGRFTWWPGERAHAPGSHAPPAVAPASTGELNS